METEAHTSRSMPVPSSAFLEERDLVTLGLFTDIDVDKILNPSQKEKKVRRNPREEDHLVARKNQIIGLIGGSISVHSLQIRISDELNFKVSTKTLCKVLPGWGEIRMEVLKTFADFSSFTLGPEGGSSCSSCTCNPELEEMRLPCDALNCVVPHALIAVSEAALELYTSLSAEENVSDSTYQKLIASLEDSYGCI